ncbi:MAG: undecaprenyl-diphosphate phosphatase [Cyclobacteriaceae bacterium]|nr:undecaprenyl-diphosphate phosphatase [Cyclobacteriaceae bacterium]
MNVWEALILGIIQGLTEFLPVSSSGHLQIGAAVLGAETSENLLFTVIVHGATVLSTLIVFRKDIINILKGLFKLELNEETKLVLYIIISMIPVGIVGVFFQSEVEQFFNGKIMFVAAMLMITGFILLASNYLGAKNKTGKITATNSFVIGLAQAFAVLPGISRSGSTIATALILGVDKEKATRFSFLMVIPPILGATLLKVKDLVEQPSLHTDISTMALFTGFVAALVFGIIACKWMINIVRKGKLIYFAYYCFAIATLTILIQLV